ncbi:MAG: phosphatidylserine decarboxylase [Deferribacteraceae bacterium]|nr:phosphatidylserine decarboxylase [Deferribacteraceae bacterium]
MIAKEGFPFIVTAAVLFVVFLVFPKWLLVVLSLTCVVFFLIFFRDPERTVPPFENIAVSAADGKVVEIKDEELDGVSYKKVSVFMNVFNVHVNRMPVTGTVVKVEHRPGKFLAADKPESSMENEQNLIYVDSKYGKMIFKQVAGLVARRTVCYAKENELLQIGDRLGIIKFSSRVDHYLPADAFIAVSLNDHVKAGETVIARFEGVKEGEES